MLSHVNFTLIIDVVRRRKTFFLIPFIAISLVSAIGANVLPKSYEAYTTILLKRDQTLNPLLEWGRAVAVAIDQGGALASFNEIVYSRTTIRSLLDSIGAKPEENTIAGWDALVDFTRRNIGTEQRGNESFRITVADKDPFVAQRSATALCNLYIQTSLKSDKQQAEDTEAYLEQKVNELKREFETMQRGFVGSEMSRLANSPSEMGSLQNTYDALQKDITDLDLTIKQQERVLKQLNEFKENLDDPTTISRIAALDPMGTLIYSDTLRSLSVRYNQLLTRYTPRYPQVVAVRKELAEMLYKFSEALEADIQNNKSKQATFANQRETTRRDMSVSVNYGELKNDRLADYLRLRENLGTAQVKLMQAKAARELAARGASKYVILDPAQVPASPSKPKINLIIGGGIAIGLVVGLAAMFIAEYYDPTIRRKQDIEVFNRPIIGYLP